eukprot:GFUD01138391.1.p1 GENE.GFUD01138391.1~~GFUD01138391.1.p1  ORF type:complete len:269 (-),score=104.61 GFUD01138391.1:89-895(-)
MALSLPPCPASLKTIQHFLKLATEHDTRDPVISYWSRLTALQTGLTLDKSSNEALALLLPLMDWLEKEKIDKQVNEAITHEVVASAHVENYAMKLFLVADKQDRAANFDKNVVKCFYSAGILFDVMQTFGPLTPEVAHYRKYAKMKAAYIHNCLKNGETPIAGPLAEDDDNDDGEEPPEKHQEEIPSVPYQPYNPPSAPIQTPAPDMSSMAISDPSSNNTVGLPYDKIARAQKLCKYAISALDYQDTNTAVENLTKALHLVKTGQELE